VVVYEGSKESEIAFLGIDLDNYKFINTINQCGLAKEDVCLITLSENSKDFLSKMPNLKLLVSMGKDSLNYLYQKQSIIKYRGTILDLPIARTIFTFCPTKFRVPAYPYIAYLDINKGLKNLNNKNLLSAREMCVYPNENDWIKFLSRTESKKYLSIDRSRICNKCTISKYKHRR
jgi:hypothetical protein